MCVCVYAHIQDRGGGELKGLRRADLGAFLTRAAIEAALAAAVPAAAVRRHIDDVQVHLHTHVHMHTC